MVDETDQGMSHDHESVALVSDSVVSKLVTAAALAALTGVLAQFSIPLPFSPAPISLQPIPVYLAGIILGPLWGGMSVVLYLLTGILGVPVFSNLTAGLGVVLGPTGGYLIGFLFAAILIGAIVHRGIEPRPLSAVSIPVQVIALLVGLVVIYAIGVPWLKLGAGYAWTDALVAGAVIFLPGDILKIIGVIGLVTGGSRLQVR